MEASNETGAVSGFEELQGCEKLPRPEPIFLFVDFATKEICSFQDRSDATETPNNDSIRPTTKTRNKNTKIQNLEQKN